MGRAVRMPTAARRATGGSSELVVRGQLLDKQDCPPSGKEHYGLVMKYQLLEVISGVWQNPASDTVLYVAHGAPEMSRSLYYKFCGTLKSFNVGDVHRLRLKEKLPGNPSPFDVVVDPYLEHDERARFLCLRADPAFSVEQEDFSHSTEGEEDDYDENDDYYSEEGDDGDDDEVAEEQVGSEEES
ncbi:SAP domain-containing protein [Balamuthia mandrillaris]